MYRVQTNDSIIKIAYKTGMSIAYLKKINDLSSDYIYPNQLIKVL